MTLSSLAVRRPVAVTMLFLGVAVVGLMSFSRLSLDMFPKIEPPMITVVTPWLGASAADIETKVTKNLEDLLATTPDLEELSAISQDNVSVVQLKLKWGANLDEATNQIRTLVSQAKQLLPEDVKESTIIRLNLAQIPILMFTITTDRGDVAEYSDFVEDYIVNDLKRIDGVATVTVFNRTERQLQVDVDRRRLDAYGLSLQQIGGALKASNLTLPAGTMDIGRSTYTIRAPGEFKSPEDVENVIVGRSQDALVYLKDVAAVHLGVEEKTAESLVDKKSSLLLMLQRESGANSVDVARAARARIAELDKTLPSGLHIKILLDLSESIVRMVRAATEATWVAAVLVILVVFLFLRRWRSSLLVALSLPVSVIAAFALLDLGGYTLNVITLSALTIVIGLVVDDSIVVVDNIVRNMEHGKGPREAAAIGPAEVSGAVTAATLTNAAIFMPVIFVSGLIGVMFKELAYVVIVTLLASLAVSLLLVPALAQWVLQRPKAETWLAATGERWFARLEQVYGRLVSWALHHRGRVVAVAMGAFALSLLITRIVGMDFMPRNDGSMLTVTAELPVGTSLEHTTSVGKSIEGILRRRIPEATLFAVRAGASRNALAALAGDRQGANIATVTCIVPERRLRDRSTFEMAEAVRPEIVALPEIETLRLDGTNPVAGVALGGQRPLTLEVYSPTNDIAELRRAARQIRKIASEIPGAVDVATDMIADNPEMQVTIDRLAAARVGVPVAAVAMAVRTGMYGSTETRYRGGTKDVDLVVRLREDDRRTIADIENLTVPSKTGQQIRLGSIATIREGRSPIEIRRLNQQRTVRVMGNVEGRALGDVANDLERRIAAAKVDGRLPAGVVTRFGGDVKEQRSMVVNLSGALILSILLIYMVMAAQFESLLDPFVVMFSVPFGITGALIALPLTGTTLSITSFLGMIMQVGIVVKNAIVLVDYIGLMRDRGMSMEEAVQKGGERRLRPVLMTALAILGGMMPMALSRGEASEIWRPMAIAVIGGVAVSTLVTLVLIPAVYALTDRWRKRGHGALKFSVESDHVAEDASGLGAEGGVA